MQLRMQWAHTAGWCGASSPWTRPSSSSQGSSWSILHSACIYAWVCPNPGAGLRIWCLGTSWVSHEPTSQVCQGPSGWHHCPAAFWLCLVSPANLHRAPSMPLSMLTAKIPKGAGPYTDEEHHLSLLSSWILTCWPQLSECGDPGNVLSTDGWSTH